ncbi:hypothetical protein NIES4071_102320 (plasmid) [Calothrix sp. NIES-4071]|nr:hypothetical protein NIES4071_102320 [Calothrix sp. NIES-4071]BAZ64613.1 hypothetical protein NIES4105_103460 [Calothrix sp. NIES-4105]
MLDFKDDNSNNSSVNELLPIDDDKLVQTETDLSVDLEENESDKIDPAKITTRHDFVTSPYVKGAFVAGFFLLGFGAIYLSLNSLMGGSNVSKKTPELTPTPTLTPFVAEQDGEAYAKLALQKQESDLKNLNGKEDTSTEKNKLAEEKNKTTTVNANSTTTNQKTNTTSTNQVTPTPTPRKTSTVPPDDSFYRRPARRNIRDNNISTTLAPAGNRNTFQARAPQTIASRPTTPTIPRLFIPSSRNNSGGNNQRTIARNDNNISRQSDPLADIERLRNLSSMGRINYALKTSSPTPTTILASNTTNSTNTSTIPNDTLTSTSTRRPGSSNSNISSNVNQNQGLIENNSIQKLTPKWEPTTINRTVEFSPQVRQKNLVQQVNYEPEESQILDERAPQYLVVGSTTKATLVTPLLLAGDKPNKNLRFVAQLNEPIKSNTGAIAIPAGTQMSITVNGIDGGFGMDAEVAAILKDGTEYPITAGTITVLAKGGNPLIARPYKGKGGEIAGYDVTLGSIAGLAKIGEVINRQDETIDDLPLGGQRTRKSGGNRNITGAFLEGAFGSLSSTVGARTRTATTEILNRPNVWYIPNNSQITLRINRSVQL